MNRESGEIKRRIALLLADLLVPSLPVPRPMPKTIMAPLHRILSLGIIILLVSYLGNSATIKEKQTPDKVEEENLGENDGKTAQGGEQEQLESEFIAAGVTKLNSFLSIDLALFLSAWALIKEVNCHFLQHQVIEYINPFKRITKVKKKRLKRIQTIKVNLEVLEL